MGDRWIECALGDFVTLQRGHDLPDDRRKPGPVPVIGSFGITGSHSVAKASRRGVTVGRSGASFGVVSYCPVDFWPLNTALYVVDFHGNDERFAYYFLRSMDFSGYNSGSAQPSLNRNFVHPIPVCAPPLPEQRAIAHILGTLDDKIELNQKTNETLEAMARALFKSWFVDFDPVRRNSARRRGGGQPSPHAPLPAGEGGKPVSAAGGMAELDALFPNSFVDSELGRIPKGWRVQSLDAIANFLNGLACQKYPPTGDQSLPVIKIADLRNGVSDKSDRASPAVGTDYIVRNGDVLFSWSGSLLVKIWTGGRGVLNQHLFKVTSNGFPRWFYYFWIKEHLPTFQSIAQDKATTMGHIKRHHLTDAKVVVPDSAILTAADTVLAPLVERSVQCDQESAVLSESRDVLLPRLLSGELAVGARKVLA